ncbi:hypothetical protein, partial [Pseudomonas sp. MAG002Y]|uniref:hypothetical protein n=1 Tax=Pseudomonas sp. MAG002Y TaxID=2678690 RepID=UPI001C60F76A
VVCFAPRLVSGIQASQSLSATDLMSSDCPSALAGIIATKGLESGFAALVQRNLQMAWDFQSRPCPGSKSYMKGGTQGKLG